jgi:hypothetical protein
MRTWKSILFLAVPALLVAAEPDESNVPIGTTCQLILLRQKSVQHELKVTPELAKKIRAFTNREYEAFQKAVHLNADEKERRLEELEKRNRQFLADNLSPGQRKRLGQITLQVTGLQQLTQPEVVRALELTEAQQQKFREMQMEARRAMETIIASPNREGRNEKLARLRAEIDKKIEAVLTDKQKEKAREHVGEPFKGEIVLEEAESGR